MPAQRTAQLERSVVPGATALLVIDLQNDYCHPNGSLARAGWDLRMVDPAVDRTLELIEVAHAHGLPVIFVRTEHSPWTDTEEWRGRYRDFDVRSDPVVQRGSWGAEFYRVAPRTDDRIVVKHRYDAFAFSDLELVLRATKITTILLAGIATNVCVETTARQAFVRDYAVVLLDDCCSTFSEAEHRSALHNIREYFGVVATGKDVAAVVKHWPARAAAS